MIGVIDYGMGNLGSVVNALRYLEEDIRLISKHEELDHCHSVIVPGVGAFGDCMSNLKERGFIDLIQQWIDSGKPLMGICLGLQILFSGSEESDGVEGLSIFDGTVKKFEVSSERKVPQIGWNRMQIMNSECPVFEGIENHSYFYLVHSYYVVPNNQNLIAGKTSYGVDYCSCVWKDNVFATQFHPEKSQDVGLKMLKNFATWSAGV